MGDFVIENVDVDFNDFGYEVCLDLLMKAKFIIDLRYLQMKRNE